MPRDEIGSSSIPQGQAAVRPLPSKFKQGAIAASLVGVALVVAACGGGPEAASVLVTSTTSTTTVTTVTTATTATTATTTSVTTSTTSSTTTPPPVLFCTGRDQCGPPELKKWAFNPPDLAKEVGDFSVDHPPKAMEAETQKPILEEWTKQPPQFKGKTVTLADIAQFVKELLKSDAFGTGDSVPYLQFSYRSREAVVAITQKMAAFLVANALMGNSITVPKDHPGGDDTDALSAAMRRCPYDLPAIPPQGPWAKSLLSYLAVLSVELADGSHGTHLIAMVPGNRNVAGEAAAGLFDSKVLQEPNICNKIENRTSGCKNDEFNNGGTIFQSLTNIAGMDVGGGGKLCHLAQSQDESLVQFYTDVFAFSFFSPYMLPSPFALLGARRYINHLSGQSSPGDPYRYNCGKVWETDWLNEQIGQDTAEVEIGLDGQKSKVTIYGSSMVAVASACAACEHGGTCNFDQLLNNACDAQRRTLDFDISRWYQAYSKTMYNPTVQDAFGTIIKSIGTGPWGSGVWWGNSQMYFLTMWLATSLFDDVTLDYYIYDQFCENPGNQCYVLGANGCAECLASSSARRMDPFNCGTKDYKAMIERFKGKPVRELYDAQKNLARPEAGTIYDVI